MKQYIEPLERTRSGLTEKEAWVRDDAVDALVRWYCREAGVRRLQQHIEKIYRKVGSVGPARSAALPGCTPHALRGVARFFC